MEQTLCLLSGIDDGVLGGIIKRLLHDNDIRFHECDGGFDDLLADVTDDVSCVILGAESRALSVEIKEILNRNNDLIVIELFDNGKSIGLYIDDISEAILNKLIGLKRHRNS